jgi:hypothetical protein
MRRTFFALVFLTAAFASPNVRAEAMFLCDLGKAPAAIRACVAFERLVSYESNPVGFYKIVVDYAAEALAEAKEKGVAGTESLKALIPFLGERARLAHTNRLVFAVTSYDPKMHDYVNRLFKEIEAAESYGLDARRARNWLSSIVKWLPRSRNPPLTS